MIAARFIVLLIVATALSGCRERAPAPLVEPAVTTTARSGPAAITLALDRDSMRTVDRLSVSISVQADDGAALDMPEFDPAGSGWTVVSRVEDPIAFSDSGPLRRVHVVLEPFLEGAYAVPPVACAWELPSGEQGVVSTEPLQIEVSSVLDADDAGDIAGLGAMTRPAEPVQEGTPVWVIAAAVGGATLLGGAVIGWTVSRRARAPAPTPLESLHALQRSRDADPDVICAEVGAAIRTARARSDAARTVLDESDRARYGRAPLTPERARALLDAAVGALEAEGPA